MIPERMEIINIMGITIAAAYPDCPVSLINRENMMKFVQGMDPQIDR